MADKRFTHLFIERPTQVINYTSPKSGGRVKSTLKIF